MARGSSLNRNKMIEGILEPQEGRNYDVNSKNMGKYTFLLLLSNLYLMTEEKTVTVWYGSKMYIEEIFIQLYYKQGKWGRVGKGT